MNATGPASSAQPCSRAHLAGAEIDARPPSRPRRPVPRRATPVRIAPPTPSRRRPSASTAASSDAPDRQRPRMQRNTRIATGADRRALCHGRLRRSAARRACRSAASRCARDLLDALVDPHDRVVWQVTDRFRASRLEGHSRLHLAPSVDRVAKRRAQQFPATPSRLVRSESRARRARAREQDRRTAPLHRSCEALRAEHRRPCAHLGLTECFVLSDGAVLRKGSGVAEVSTRSRGGRGRRRRRSCERRAWPPSAQGAPGRREGSGTAPKPVQLRS